MPRPVLGPKEPPGQSVLRVLSLWVKWPGCQADHSPPSSDKVKNEWIPLLQTYAFMTCPRTTTFTIAEVAHFTWKNHYRNCKGSATATFLHHYVKLHISHVIPIDSRQVGEQCLKRHNDYSQIRGQIHLTDKALI